MSHAPAATCAIYSTFGDDPDLAPIIDIFVGELPDRASKMETCYHQSDWEGLRQLAHQLRGAAGSYGFQRITDLAERLEKVTHERGPKAAICNALAELADLCRRACARAPGQDATSIRGVRSTPARDGSPNPDSWARYH